MSALEKMQEKILQDARAKADEIVKAATVEADEILGQARALAAKRRDEELACGRERTEESRLRILTLAELDARRQVLATKASLIEDVFSKVARYLAALEPAAYKAYLKKAMLSAAKTGDEEVIMSPRDQGTVGSEVVAEVNAELANQGRKASLRLSNGVREFSGGFVLKSGNVETNCTFDAILAREREAVLVDVAEILFEQDQA